MAHEITRVVAEADIDELGHASNLVYVRWVIDAAVSHSSALRLSPAEYRQRGQSFVVRRHTIDYLRPSVLGNRIVVETRVTALRGTTSERETVMKTADAGLLVAHAHTLWAFMDLASGRPVRIPPDIRAAFVLEPRVHGEGRATPARP